MLTVEQRATLKADIEASVDPAVIAALGGGVVGRDDTTLAAIYNTESTYVAWKTALTEADIVGLTSPEATSWDWTAYIATSVAEKMAWERIFNTSHTINPSLPQIRAGIAAIFNGPSGADQRTHLLAMGKRFATRAEVLFATGTGTTGTPGTLDFEGVVTINDIGAAFNG